MSPRRPRTARFLRAAAGIALGMALLEPPTIRAQSSTAQPAPPPADTVAVRYPDTRSVDTVDTLHGVAVPDPYRWLEDDTAPEVRAWIDAQNGLTRALLSDVPERAKIRERLTELLSIGTLEPPRVRGGRRFFTKRAGLQNQPILYVQEGNAAPRPLIDPNALAADGSVALDWWYPSPTGRLLAWGSSSNGDEWSTLRVLDVAAGNDMAIAIPRTRASSVAWLPNESGFYYTRYPAPGDVPKGEEHYHRHIRRHVLGTDPAKDPVVFGPGRAPEDWPHVQLSRDGRWLVVTVEVGWERTDVYLFDRQNPEAGWRPLAERDGARYQAEFLAGDLFLWTNRDAPRGRVVRVDPLRPDAGAWTAVQAETTDVLQSITAAGGRLFLHYLHDASSRVRVVDRAGTLLGDVDLPVRGSVYGITGEPEGTEAYIGFHSYFWPPTAWRVDPASGALTEFDRVAADIDTTRYVLEQVRYPSKDGTKISMFLVHRKGLKKTGQHPTLLTGYGGFNQPVTPVFQRSLYLWLEQGGVLAVANLRGGGEYGEEWHRAGMLANKQNVFDDFLAAANWLIRQKYTSGAKLVAQGGSNGGLLVAAALVQDPKPFRAIVCQVPLADMLRYHRFLIARLWVPEYGSADDAEAFEYLRRYSPYHNVKDGTAYPAVLVATAASDSRVAPLHARKLAARLQAATTSGRPVLLRHETAAGHGAGKPVSRLIDEQTDIWTFVFAQVGISMKKPGR